MFVGRETELKFLNQHYEKEGNRILVLYGQRGVGKTALLQEFVRDKAYFTYTARACSAREQRFQWGRELREKHSDVSRFPEYEEIFEVMFADEQIGKKILVIQEFHHIIKSDTRFLPELIRFLENRRLSKPIMVILCTSASGWVENSMVSRIGSLALSINGLLKVREFKFAEMRAMYPAYSEDDAVRIYAALGGIPGLWNSFDATLSAKENIIRNILRRDSRLHEEMSVYIAEELREPAVYNTILSVMSDGFGKLNDIYRHTGFSRAKISVYLKNLMELELVEKVFSGTYRIANPYVRFYFKFLFSHKSRLSEMTEEAYYAAYVEPEYEQFTDEAYQKICMEYLARSYHSVEEWCWKPGNIYLKASSDDREIVAVSSYSGTFTGEDLEWLLFSIKKMNLKTSDIEIYTSAAGGERLNREELRGKAKIITLC